MDWPTTRSPMTEDELRRSLGAFQRGLRSMSIEQLMELSSRQAIAIEEGQRSALSQLLTGTRDLDQPVLRSEPTVSPSSARPADRGAAHSAPPTSPRPSPLDLLAGSSRMGHRLAAKLVAADARRRRR